MKETFFLVLTMLLIGCATTSKNFNKISLGMSKEQVVSILGEPISVSSKKGNQEFLNYRFAESKIEYHQGIRIPYYVLIENDIVKEYGREGDFIDHISNYNDRELHDRNFKEGTNTTQHSVEIMHSELKLLKELFDDGILTKEEYDAKKKDILDRN